MIGMLLDSRGTRLKQTITVALFLPLGHVRSHSRDSFLQSGQGPEGGASESGDGRNQVVAVGTPLATVVGTQQGPVMVSSVKTPLYKVWMCHC